MTQSSLYVEYLLDDDVSAFDRAEIVGRRSIAAEALHLVAGVRNDECSVDMRQGHGLAVANKDNVQRAHLLRIVGNAGGVRISRARRMPPGGASQ